jgi:hypothetical protein
LRINLPNFALGVNERFKLMSDALERWLKIIGAALTLIGILAGLYQFSRTQAINAARPFLEKKLKWCEEAVETGAGIAIYGRDSALDPEGVGTVSRRVDRFWTLYWGIMGMVENQDVTDAMVKFGDGLKTSDTSGDKGRALTIAHACRREMAHDWSPIWAR